MKSSTLLGEPPGAGIKGKFRLKGISYFSEVCFGLQTFFTQLGVCPGLSNNMGNPSNAPVCPSQKGVCQKPSTGLASLLRLTYYLDSFHSSHLICGCRESPTFRSATFRFRQSDQKLSVWWHMRLTAHQSGDTIDLQPISLVTHLDLSPWASLSDLRNEFFVKFPMWSGFHAENFNTSRELELAANRAELVNQAEPIPGPDHDQKMSTFFKK